MSEAKQLSLANPKGYALRKDLERSLETFRGLVETFEEMTGGKLEQVSQEYQELTEKMAALERELAEKERVATLDLNLRIKASKKDAFNTLAKELDFAVITNEDLTELKVSLDSLRSRFADEVAVAKKEAEARAAQSYNAQKNALEAGHRAEQAENVATIKSLESQLLSARDENERLRSLLKESQASAVQIAQAMGHTTVNVPSSK